MTEMQMMLDGLEYCSHREGGCTSCPGNECWAEEAIKRLEANEELLRDYQRKLNTATEALVNATKIIKSQPSIVLCKDCKYGNMSIDNRPYRLPCRQNDKPQDWYCADGKAIEQNGQ